MKKYFIVSSLLICSALLTVAQTPNPSFGTCFSKGNKKSIENKMSKLIQKVSEESGCTAEQITYKADEYYTTFYTHECRHLPKRITFDACGKKMIYKHKGLSGAITYWLMGSWSQAKEQSSK